MEYAKFQNAGYMGLYGGLAASGIHSQVGQIVREAIAKNDGTMPEDLPTP